MMEAHSKRCKLIVDDGSIVNDGSLRIEAVKGRGRECFAVLATSY